MKKLTLTLSLFSAILLFSCGSSNSEEPKADAETTTPDKPKEEAVAVIVDIKQIAGKSLDDVEKVLGKAESKEKVKGFPCENANCERANFKNGGYEIIFKEGKANRITINNTPNLANNDNAIQALGFPASAPSFKTPNTVSRWSNIDGIAEISFFSDYVLVDVTKSE